MLCAHSVTYSNFGRDSNLVVHFVLCIVSFGSDLNLSFILYKDGPYNYLLIDIGLLNSSMYGGIYVSLKLSILV